MCPDNIEIFEELTKNALAEEDIDKFIDLLIQRDAYAQQLMNRNVEIDKRRIQICMLMEEKILKRLEEERKKLLVDMDQLSRNKSAAKKYSPKFPFPPMPVFFDKKG